MLLNRTTTIVRVYMAVRKLIHCPKHFIPRYDRWRCTHLQLIGSLADLATTNISQLSCGISRRNILFWLVPLAILKVQWGRPCYSTTKMAAPVKRFIFIATRTYPRTIQMDYPITLLENENISTSGTSCTGAWLGSHDAEVISPWCFPALRQ